MKNRIKLILIPLLCASLLLQGNPVVAAGDSDNNEPTSKTKYTAKRIKKPPFCITVNGNEDKDFSTQPWDAGSQTKINIIGQRNDDSIAGDWQFYVTFSMVFSGETEKIQGVNGTLQMGISAQVDGSAKGDMIDLTEKKKKEKEEKKDDWKPLFPEPAPKKPAPVHSDPNTIRNSQEAPKELYQCEFDVDLAGTMQNMGQNTVYGKLTSGSQWVSVDANFLPDDGNVKTKGKVRLIIDSNNNVIAYIETDGKPYGPYAGVFTCEEELETKRRDSGTWPIWGVWTDVNPYEPMPDTAKDAKTVSEQIKNDEEVKKIKYPEGRWVKLLQGKKEDVTTYTTLQGSAEDITYESGEIWPYPGSAMFKPDALTVYSKDLKEVLRTYKPMEYELVITYHTANDTITYPRFGSLVRVRNADLLGVWSSIGNIPMPAVSGNADIPMGTWYEFVRGGGDTAEKTQKGYSAAYTFTRIISKKDKSPEIDKGTAIIMPIAGNELVLLTGIETEVVAPDGTKTKLEKAKDNETLTVTDFNKSEGKVKLGLSEYTFIPGLKLKGSWSTIDPPVGPPDAKNGVFMLRDENDEVFDPPADGQWVDFDSDKKTFTWTQMLQGPDGILARKGKYRTFGKDLLLLSEIKGSFYPRPGMDIQGFEDEDYMYGEKLFHVEQKSHKENNPVSMSIVGIAEFLPITEPE